MTRKWKSRENMSAWCRKCRRWRSSRLTFVFALCQFRGPDYLAAWNRLRQREELWSREQVHCSLRVLSFGVRIYDPNDSVHGALKDHRTSFGQGFIDTFDPHLEKPQGMNPRESISLFPYHLRTKVSTKELRARIIEARLKRIFKAFKIKSERFMNIGKAYLL